MQSWMMWSASAIAAVPLAACGPSPVPAPSLEPAATVTQPAALETDAWLGEWIGVEGNTLKIEKGDAPGAYRIAESQLDGPISYNGRAEGASIVFQDQDMQTRTIKSGAGEQTGLKYLQAKSNCLWIEAGRGFCRDEAVR